MSRPETWIEKRFAQALLQGVKPGFVGKRFLGLDGQISMKLAEKVAGGTWLNGEIFLTNDAVVFYPSVVDRTLVRKDSLPELQLLLAEIESVSFRKGALAKIMELITADLTLSARGLGMDSFADAIKARIGREGGAT